MSEYQYYEFLAIDRPLTQEEQEVVARTKRSGSRRDEYMFLHAYMREAAYAMLTDDDRELAERLASEWLAGADRGVA